MPKKNSTTQSNTVSLGYINHIIALAKRRHARHYRDNYFHLWADLLLAGILIGSVIILLWLILWQPKPDFELSARTVSARIVSGQTEDFVISYKNTQGNPVQGATVSLTLPPHFILQSTEPSDNFNTESTTFSLGDLAKNAKGDLHIKGVVQGAINDKQFLGVDLTYLDNNTFKKQVLDSITYSIDSSALELQVQIPDTAYRGIPFNGSLDLKNTGQVDMQSIGLDFSGGWNISPTNENFENNILSISNLKAGETRHIDFSAMTDTAALTETDFTVQSSLIFGTEIIPQTQTSHKVSIRVPSLNTIARFKDSSFSGSDLGLQIAFRNTEQSPISNLVFKIESKKTNASVKSFSTPTNTHFVLLDNSLTYQNSIGAGESGNLEALVSINRQTIELNDFLNLALDVSYRFNNTDYSYALALPTLKIDSNVTINSGGYYYGPQGDQLGIGPIPPHVGIPTTYWVIWEANNLGNDLSNAELSADLPANVVWLDQTSLVAGSASYSPVSRRILWHLDSIPKSGGNYRLSFAVSIVPDQSELGTIPNLVTNIQFTAKDEFTGSVVTKKLANITTNIESDPKAGGKGAVVPME